MERFLDDASELSDDSHVDDFDLSSYRPLSPVLAGGEDRTNSKKGLVLVDGVPAAFRDRREKSVSLLQEDGETFRTDEAHAGCVDFTDANLRDPNNETHSDRPFYYPPDHPDHQQTFTREEIAAMEINELCDKADVPRNFYDELIALLKKHTQPNADSSPVKLESLPSRKLFMKAVQERHPTAKPTVQQVALETKKSHFEEEIDRERLLRDVVDVIFFDFGEQLKDLLSDLSLMGNLDNLNVNTGTQERFDPFVPSNGSEKHLDEVMDGKWYQDTVNAPVTGTDGNVFFLPILICVDKTGTDAFQRHGLEPVMFTTALFKRHVRNDPSAWRILGFIPDLEAKSSAVKKQSTSSVELMGLSCRNYHKCLSVVLQSFKAAQQRDMKFHLRLGSCVKHTSLLCPLAFVIGDAKSQDMLCGRFGGCKTQRMSRKCCIPHHECGDPNAQCKFVNARTMERFSELALMKFDPADGRFEPHTGEPVNIEGLTEKEVDKRCKEHRRKLHSMSQHRHDSAFVDVWFGENKMGIFGATPTDLMHAFLEGVVKCVVRLFVDPLTDSAKADFDFWMDHVFGRFKSSERLKHLRSNFTHGFTNLSQLTSDEWAGMVQTLTLAFQFPDGVKPLETRFVLPNQPECKRHKCPAVEVHDPLPIYLGYEEEPTSFEGKTDVLLNREPCKDSDGHRDLEVASKGSSKDPVVTREDMLDLLERILSFHAFYKRGAPFEWDNCNATSDSGLYNWGTKERYLRIQTRELMSMIVSRLPRQTGNGWNLQKFHELLHIPTEMSLFGSPANWDAGVCESSLKTWAKKPAKTSQKWGPRVFNYQVASRLHEKASFLKFRRNARSNADSFQHRIERENDADSVDHLIRRSNDSNNCSEEAMGVPIRRTMQRRNSFSDSSSESSDEESENQCATKAVESSNKMEETLLPDCQTTRSKGSDSMESELVGKPKYHILYDRQKDHVSAKWIGRKKQIGLVEVHPVVISCFQEMISEHPQLVPSNLDESVVVACGHTEHRRDGILYRAHPNYRSRGPWCDWSLVQHDTERENYAKRDNCQRWTQTCTEFPRDQFPCKILGFFSLANNGTEWILLHPTEDNIRNSRLTESWRLHHGVERTGRNPVGRDGKPIKDGRGKAAKHAQLCSPELDFVEIDAIDLPICVVEEEPGITEHRIKTKENRLDSIGLVVRLKTRETYWPAQFLAGDYRGHGWKEESGHVFKHMITGSRFLEGPHFGMTSLCVDWKVSKHVDHHVHRHDPESDDESED